MQRIRFIGNSSQLFMLALDNGDCLPMWDGGERKLLLCNKQLKNRCGL
jgi:hypothetical protein